MVLEQNRDQNSEMLAGSDPGTEQFSWPQNMVVMNLMMNNGITLANHLQRQKS